MKENPRFVLRNKIRAMLGKQKEMDKMILESESISEYPYECIKLSLIIELSKLANEFLSKFECCIPNEQYIRDRMLSEFVEAFKFLISLCVVYRMSAPEFVKNMDEANDFMKTAEKENKTILISKILASVIYNISEGLIDNAVGSMKILADTLGITIDEIYEVYMDENKKECEAIERNKQ